MYISNHKSKFLSALIVASILFKSPAYARPGGRGEHHGPPPEAIEACADLSEGDACSFTGRYNDEVQGTCIVPPDGDEGLACAPEGGPPDARERSDTYL